ncbi:MAG: HypC/HybG/HupF family hydrogenase formation chaperone [Dermatophilaceae bacterium]
MCLGIPGQIVDMVDAEEYLAKVEVSGVQRTVSVRLLADEGIGAGDWVLVHVGFAMAKIDEDEAAATLGQLAAMGREYRDEVDSFRTSDL